MADVPSLLATVGPPGEWSGAVASCMSPEQRQDLLRAWRSMSAEERNTVTSKWREHFNAAPEDKTAALPVSKERRQAARRVDAHFRSSDPKKKWDILMDNVKRKSFVAAVKQDTRADPKFERHVDQMGRLLTGKAVGKVGQYDIVRMRGGGTGCTCPDWRYKKSVAGTGEQDCKHITEFKEAKGVKTASTLEELRAGYRALPINRIRAGARLLGHKVDGPAAFPRTVVGQLQEYARTVAAEAQPHMKDPYLGPLFKRHVADAQEVAKNVRHSRLPGSVAMPPGGATRGVAALGLKSTAQQAKTQNILAGLHEGAELRYGVNPKKLAPISSHLHPGVLLEEGSAIANLTGGDATSALKMRHVTGEAAAMEHLVKSHYPNSNYQFGKTPVQGAWRRDLVKKINADPERSVRLFNEGGERWAAEGAKSASALSPTAAKGLFAAGTAAGVGALALGLRHNAKSTQFTSTQKQMRSTAMHEVAGLGLLASPYVASLAEAGAKALGSRPGRVGMAARAAHSVLEPLSHAMHGGPLSHANEVLGLGVLARPSMQEMRHLSAHAAKHGGLLQGV